jgi:hypothetical protein
LYNDLKSNSEFQDFDKLINEIKVASHYLDKVSSMNIRKQELKVIFDMIYRNCSSKAEGLIIIKKVLSQLKV